MTHDEAVQQSRNIIKPRSSEYGAPRKNHERIAVLATIMLNREVTTHEIAVVLMCLKMSRIAQSPKHTDSYVDLINYTAFACEFATEMSDDE